VGATRSAEPRDVDRWMRAKSKLNGPDRSAFDLRRELDITIQDPAIVTRLEQVFEHDWFLSHHYKAPDPLDPQSHHHETDFLMTQI
jgi:hypothetical protein